MAVVEEEIQVPMWSNGRIDWDTLIRRYAKEHDMSYAHVLRWCSERSSLEVAAELMGINVFGASKEFGDAKKRSKTTLNQFGAFLDRRGYHVPRLFEIGNHQYERCDEDMSMTLTCEGYLAERKAGKTRAQVARDQGISAPALLYHLGKWGLKDSAVEERELARMKQHDATPPAPVHAEERAAVVEGVEKALKSDVSSMDIGAAETSNKEPAAPTPATTVRDYIAQPEEAAREEYITVRIPVKAPRLRLVGADAAAVLYQLNRNDLIAIGVECLRKAAEWATEELTDIMGDVDVTEFVQKFMDRKTTSVLQEGEACCDPTHEQVSRKERQSQDATTSSGAHSEVRAS